MKKRVGICLNIVFVDSIVYKALNKTSNFVHSIVVLNKYSKYRVLYCLYNKRNFRINVRFNYRIS